MIEAPMMSGLILVARKGTCSNRTWPHYTGVISIITPVITNPIIICCSMITTMTAPIMASTTTTTLALTNSEWAASIERLMMRRERVIIICNYLFPKPGSVLWPQPEDNANAFNEKENSGNNFDSRRADDEKGEGYIFRCFKLLTPIHHGTMIMKSIRTRLQAKMLILEGLPTMRSISGHSC